MKTEIEKEDEGYSFNFMPLLDAIFLLTIFFILTITVQEEEKILPMNLPTSEQPEMMKIENALIVEIHKSGKFYIKNEVVEENELAEKIKNIFSHGGKEIPCGSSPVAPGRFQPGFHAWQSAVNLYL